MLGGGTAAAAHHAHAVLLREFEERIGKGLWFERVDCLAVHV